MSTRVALVQCGESKKAALKDGGLIAAKELYNGAYFRTKRYTAEDPDIFDEYYILSGEFGLLNPEEEIGYYDTNLGELTPGQRSTLYWNLLEDFKNSGLAYNVDQEVVVLVSQRYLDHHPDKRGWTLRDIIMTLPGEKRFPFDGSPGMREQTSWLTDCREAGCLVETAW
jgi:hypothetical protein